MTPPSPFRVPRPRPYIQVTGFYLHIQDLADGLVGPFPDADKCSGYWIECRDRGDAGEYMAVYPGSSPLLNQLLDSGAVLHTVEEDRELAAKLVADPSASFVFTPPAA